MSSVQKKLGDEINNWDNVKSVSAVAILSNNATANDGTLFLNGNHRLPVSVLLSFTLADNNSPGPTKQEIQDALSWINYADESAVTQLSFYAEDDEDFDPTYNLYYYQNTDSVSKNVGNVEASYQYTINYQIQPSANVVTGNLFKLAIELNAQRSGTQNPFVFKSSSGSSSVQAYYDLNFVPNKTYVKPVNGGTSTINNHYLKLEEESEITHTMTSYTTYSVNNHYVNLYFLTIDPTPVSGFTFHFRDFGKISNFWQLTTSDTTDKLYVPSHFQSRKESTMYNDFTECVFYTYQWQYKGNTPEVILKDQSINAGANIATTFLIDIQGYFEHAADINSSVNISVPDYCFLLVYTSADYAHTGDTRGPWGNSSYTVPFTDNYGNLVQAVINLADDSTPSIGSVF